MSSILQMWDPKLKIELCDTKATADVRLTGVSLPYAAGEE